MIIDPKIRAGYRSMGDYLKDQGENEKTRVVHISDPTASNLNEAFQNMWAIGCNSRAKKPLLHFSINPHPKDRRLTDEEAMFIAKDFMRRCNQNPDDHQFVIVEHIKGGRQHFHVVVGRISMKTGKAVDPGKYHKAKMNCARVMERKFGLRSPFSPNDKEIGNAKILGRSISDIDRVLYWAFKSSRNGKEFIALTHKEGFNLLRGRANKKGEPTILAQDSQGGVYRLTASLMRSDVDFRKGRLIPKFGSEIDALGSFDPKRSDIRHGSARGYHPPGQYAGMVGELVTASSRKKKGEGKGGGAGGGAAAILSALRIAPSRQGTRRARIYSHSKVSHNGPERRCKNLWVPVERRDYKPKCPSRILGCG
jgi:hypothetical protein